MIISVSPGERAHILGSNLAIKIVRSDSVPTRFRGSHVPIRGRRDVPVIQSFPVSSLSIADNIDPPEVSRLALQRDLVRPAQ